MTVKILHLYSDIMNLYGEYANITMFSRYLSDMGHEVIVDTLSLYEDKDIDSYDFYYMGAGSEKAQYAVLPELLKYKESLQKNADSGKVMLFTGSAFELLGNKITDKNQNEHIALCIGDFECYHTDKRITGDCIAKTDIFKSYIVGFINKCSRIEGVKNPLFTLLLGKGNDNKQNFEGFTYNNVYATELTGPLLVRNPHFMKHIAQLILERSGESVNDEIKYEQQQKAYEICISELMKRIEN